MTINEWAEKLTGREYREELTKEEEHALKADGLIAAFGASDDLLEFRGALHDEVGAWDSAMVKLAEIKKGGKIIILDDEEDWVQVKPLYIRKVFAIWNPIGLDGEVWASWHIRIYGVPQATFDIMEDGELYCRGIVFEARHIGLL
jgi:hypothetical protein